MAIIAFQPGPGALVLAFWCDDVAEYDDMEARALRGELTFDDNAIASVDEASDRAALFLRFTLAGPYVPPPLVLHFEDVQVAVTIGETGWYAFDGGLYRAVHRGGGAVVLDRVFESEPPAIFHGRVLEGRGVTEEAPDDEARRP